MCMKEDRDGTFGVLGHGWKKMDGRRWNEDKGKKNFAT